MFCWNKNYSPNLLNTLNSGKIRSYFSIIVFTNLDIKPLSHLNASMRNTHCSIEFINWNYYRVFRAGRIIISIEYRKHRHSLFCPTVYLKNSIKDKPKLLTFVKYKSEMFIKLPKKWMAMINMNKKTWLS